MIEAVTDLSGWNEDEGTLKCSSIGIKLGNSIEKCALILKCLGIKSQSKSIIKQAEYFITLNLLSWNDEIARLSRGELEIRKWTVTITINQCSTSASKSLEDSFL